MSIIVKHMGLQYTIHTVSRFTRIPVSCLVHSLDSTVPTRGIRRHKGHDERDAGQVLGVVSKFL